MDQLLTDLGNTLQSADARVICALVHGSRTTGWAEPDSDLDVLVFSDGPESRGDVWLSELLTPLATRFSVRIDPMHISVDLLEDVRAQQEVVEGAWPLFRFAAVAGLPVLSTLQSVLAPRILEGLQRPITPELAAMPLISTSIGRNISPGGRRRLTCATQRHTTAPGTGSGLFPARRRRPALRPSRAS
jgi:predicted nucleotidyltransferase